jgi:hypothetical protein
LITLEEIDRHGEHTKVEIFSRCKTHLDDADIVIALLDGPQVDDRVCAGLDWEISKGASENGFSIFLMRRVKKFFSVACPPSFCPSDVVFRCSVSALFPYLSCSYLPSYSSLPVIPCLLAVRVEGIIAS